MNLERERERSKRRAEIKATEALQQQRKARLEKAKSDLFAVFGEKDAHKRGKSLERVLNLLFAAEEILVREAFTVKGKSGEGVIEQIDGLIEVNGELYLVEVKWWNTPLGTADVAQHIVRVYGRGGQARGLFISYTDFTSSAITTCRDALLQGRIIVLAQLQEIVDLLNRDGDLKTWLKEKVNALIADRDALHSHR